MVTDDKQIEFIVVKLKEILEKVENKTALVDCFTLEQDFVENKTLIHFLLLDNGS